MSHHVETKPLPVQPIVQPIVQQYNTNIYRTGREHIVSYPPGFIAVRIIQLICCLNVLGLCGFVMAAGSRVTPGLALSLFTSLSTMIVVIYYIVAHYGAPVLYNYWAVLTLEIFHVIFWLIAFPALGADVGATIYYGYSSRGTDDIVASAGAAAGFGAACFILFCVSLGVHGSALHRHRASGGHCMPVTSQRNYQQPGIPMVQQPAHFTGGGLAPQQHQGMPQTQWSAQSTQLPPALPQPSLADRQLQQLHGQPPWQ